MRSKKGIELSMNVIIIAVMALIVLVVVLLIMTGQLGKTRISLNKTSATYSGEQCEIPGTSRTCRPITKCQETGGISYGKLNCLGVEVTCCSE